MLPASTWTKPGTSGPNPWPTAGFPVAAIIASERPWKLLLREMIFHRFGRRFLAAQAGEFAGGFVGLEAAVAEKCLAGEGETIQSLGELDLRLGVKGVADVPEFFHLGSRGGDQVGMAMAENRPAEAGEEIEILFSVGIPKVGAAAADHDDGLAGVIADQDF